MIIAFCLYHNKKRNFMRTVHSFLVIVSVCVLASCTSNSDSWLNEISNNNIQSLSLQEIKMEPLIGRPYQIDIIKNLLIIADEVDKKALLLYNLADSSSVRVLNIGQGPEEITMPIEILVTNRDSTLYAFQRRTSLCREYDIRKLSEGLVQMENETLLEGADRFTILKDGYVCLGFYEEGIMTTFDQEGQLIKHVELFPDIPIKDIGNKYKMFQGYLAFNESTGCLIYAPSFASQILFYNQNNEGNWIKQSSFRIGNGLLEKRIKEYNGQLDLRGDDIQNCINVYSTDRYFYVLYAGCKMKKTEEKPKERYVLRFTSDGSFDRLYKVNPTVQCICVTENDSTLYALMIGSENEYVVGESKL